MKRLPRVLAIVVAVALLAGCWFISPKEPLETAIPAALVASDLGVTKAEASTGMDGFTKYLSVFVVVDRDTATTEDVLQIIKLTVDNCDHDNIDVLHVGARDGTADSYEYIDLGAIAVELGWPRNPVTPDVFTIGWEQAVALAEEGAPE